ncbi:MAG: glucosylceramidase, partial [Bacteroidales bacterium]|nr:glucosylceramidase [Bacteroidales bacterium]
MSPYVVKFTGDTYQTVDGFGLAVTQASCYNLLKMNAEDRTRVLTELFSPTEGAGSSLIRVCIGGSDFSMDEFTWCDTKGIEHFAVHRLDTE